MSVELFVQPDTPPMSWDAFRASHTGIGVIALDGYVADGPLFDEAGPYLNANHHENVNRLATLSTAQQIHMYLRMGLDLPFMKDGEFTANVYANDCDQDVCAAWYLLNNIGAAKQATPQLNRFIAVAGMLDVTAGAYPFPKDLQIIEELAWVFEPYTDFRTSGEMGQKDGQQYRSVIDAVEARIESHVAGKGEQLQLQTQFKKIGGGENWTMIEETGEHGRIGAFMSGINAYVSAQQSSEGTWRYTIGRRSEYIPFDVPGLLAHLNIVEACTDDRWGGADIVGGSPRVGGSKLSPQELQKVINDFIGTTA